MTEKELKRLKKEIADHNNCKPRDILIFIDKDGNYYDWFFKELKLR